MGDSIPIGDRANQKKYNNSSGSSGERADEAGEHVACEGSVGELRGHVDRLGSRGCERTGSDEAIESE